MLLEIATSLGAIVGAVLAAWVHPAWIGFIFGLVLLHASFTSLRSHSPVAAGVELKPDSLAQALRLDGTYPTSQGMAAYRVQSVPAGFTLMGVAGVLSGLLGIGSGAIKVLAMDAASAGIYFSKGYIDPGLSMPVMLGVLAGSLTGARLLSKAPVKQLRLLFATIVVVLAIEMIYSSLTGRI
jgi:hypothetical protein